MLKLRRFLAPVVLGLALASPAGLLASDFHVAPAPAGSASGNGPKDRRWDLPTALAQPSKVGPGDTIWVHGGTYTGHYTSSLIGSADKPIVVRAFPGERATIDGNDGGNAVTLVINGSYAWYWGLEITNSDPTRVSASTDNPPRRGEGINLLGPGTRLINVVIHDAAQGVLSTASAPNAEVYGCLIYYNGYDGPDRGHGHGVYVQNETGAKRIADNILFGQWGIGVHAYTEGSRLDNLTFEGNTSFGNGVPSTVSGPTTDFLVGASGGAATDPASSTKVAKNTVLKNNYAYFLAGTGTAVNLGYSKGIASPTILDNYFVGATALTLINAFRPIVMTGNTLFGAISGFQSAEFPNNTYYAARPTGVKVFVRNNQYEPGRANITIYNWDKAAAVDVPVAGLLNPGMEYELRNAQNFYASPVLSGKYDGAPLHVPMTDLVAAVPLGKTALAPTGPEFQVFILLPKTPPPVPRQAVVSRVAPGGRAPLLVERPAIQAASGASAAPAASSGTTAARIRYFPGVDTGSGQAWDRRGAALSVSNRGTEPATVSLRFLEHDRDNTAAALSSFVLEAGESLSVEKAVTSLFGSTNTDGALEVESGPFVDVSVRDDAPGAPAARPDIPALFPAAAATRHEFPIERDSELVLLNPGPGGAVISLTLLLAPTTALATVFVLVPPRGYVRRGLGTLFPSLATQSDGPARLAVDAGTLPVFAFLGPSRDDLREP